jgi:hypothetical protein
MLRYKFYCNVHQLGYYRVAYYLYIRSWNSLYLTQFLPKNLHFTRGFSSRIARVALIPKETDEKRITICSFKLVGVIKYMVL